MTTHEIETALGRLPRSRLCSFSTPTERLARLEQSLHCGPIYIKRDDLNGVGPGGNKVRPLEYLLGEAVGNHCDVVIASGQENSNLCSIAASACCRLGLGCILVHNNEPPQRWLGNILLNRLSGVEEHYIGAVSEEVRNQYIESLVSDLRGAGKRPYVVENGATTVRGAVGYIHIPLELEQQRERQPVYDLFVPGGNGGLAAGVVFGTALLGGPFHVHVITVENEKQELENILHRLLEGLQEETGLTPAVAPETCMTVYEAYRGAGWGIPTRESDQMIEKMARLEGIFLERIYTSKTAWGMCDLLERGLVRSKGACLIHSGGFASLFYQYQS